MIVLFLLFFYVCTKYVFVYHYKKKKIKKDTSTLLVGTLLNLTDCNFILFLNKILSLRHTNALIMDFNYYKYSLVILCELSVKYCLLLSHLYYGSRKFEFPSTTSEDYI